MSVVKVTSPVKSFAAESRVIAASVPPILSKVDVPATVMVPLSVIVPAAVVIKFWPIATVPRSMSLMSRTSTLLVPELLKLTAPVKSLDALSNVIAAAPAVILDVLFASILPV